MNSKNTILSERSAKVLQNLCEDYLIEVFRPWDCHEQEWADVDTFQFRFETQDLLVGRDPNQENADRRWEVLTGFEGIHQGSTEGLIGDCICWLVDESLIDEPGAHGRVIDLTLSVLALIDQQTAE